MAYTIAVAGKGGVGKTTVCGMMIDALIKGGKGPLLVVDADANSNLNEVLGVEAGVSLGQIREEIAQAELRGDTIPKSMTKADYAEYRFESALAEEDDFDMLVMGRTQGKGCYCYVNGVLKSLLDKYIGAYRYVVIDNEAGMEHIARGTLPHVDALLLVSDCSRRGVQAVARIAEMEARRHEAHHQPCARRRSFRRRARGDRGPSSGARRRPPTGRCRLRSGLRRQAQLEDPRCQPGQAGAARDHAGPEPVRQPRTIACSR